MNEIEIQIERNFQLKKIVNQLEEIAIQLRELNKNLELK